MATESPIRMLEGGGNWPSHRKVHTFGSSPTNTSSEELQLLLRGQSFEGKGRDAIFNRSESAPPSIEGSFAAMKKIVSQQDSSLNANLASTMGGISNCLSEEQSRGNPAYSAFYCSSDNLNPILPPPLISWENQRLGLVHGACSHNNNWRVASFSNCSNGSMYLSQSISTYDEGSEDNRSPQRTSNDWTDKSNRVFPGQDTTSSGQHKSLVEFKQLLGTCQS